MAMLNDSPTFKIHDDYYTPKKAWEQINHLIPKDKVILEGCMLNSLQSKSPEYLTDLGHKVIFDTTLDFITGEIPQCDMIITNPPFKTEIKKQILTRLVEIDKPFIIIMNVMNTFTKYIRKIFKGNLQHLQIITPDTKVLFNKLKDGELVKTKPPSFYCIYLCYKMELTPEQLWL
tara:strand:+ start:1824 stop:2348 length:525 start_codon:yes stop_codon:yes gene_type:complete